MSYPIHPKIVPHPAEAPDYQPVRKALMRIGRDFPYVSGSQGNTFKMNSARASPDKIHLTGKPRQFEPKNRLMSVDGKAYCDMTQKQLEDLFTSSIVPQAKNFLKEGGNTTMSQIGYGNVPRINPPKVPKGERPGITEVNPVKDYKNTAVCSDFPRYCTTTSGAELFKDGTYDEMIAATRKDDGITKLPVMFQPNLALLNYRPGLGYTDLDKVVFGQAVELKKQSALDKIRKAGIKFENSYLEEIFAMRLVIDKDYEDAIKQLGISKELYEEPDVKQILDKVRTDITATYQPRINKLTELAQNYKAMKSNIGKSLETARAAGLVPDDFTVDEAIKNTALDVAGKEIIHRPVRGRMTNEEEMLLPASTEVLPSASTGASKSKSRGRHRKSSTAAKK